MKRIPALCLVTALLGAPVLFAQEPAEKQPAPAAAQATDVAAVLKKLEELDAHIAALERKVQSISRFLGDTQSYGTDSLDDRIRDLQRGLDDLQRSVDRLR